MTANQSDAAAPPATQDIAEFAQRIAASVQAQSVSTDFGTVKVRVATDGWVSALTKARDEEGLDFFSWLSAIDWAREVAVGDGVEGPDDLDERYEVLCMVATLEDGKAVIFSTDVAKDAPRLESLVDVFRGAEWHEREAGEMFGIDFRGHPKLEKLYLPDSFEGHPLRKSFPLLSREVKPWPGIVDVEDMPSTENAEAAPGVGGEEVGE